MVGSDKTKPGIKPTVQLISFRFKHNVELTFSSELMHKNSTIYIALLAVIYSEQSPIPDSTKLNGVRLVQITNLCRISKFISHRPEALDACISKVRVDRILDSSTTSMDNCQSIISCIASMSIV